MNGWAIAGLAAQLATVGLIGWATWMIRGSTKRMQETHRAILAYRREIEWLTARVEALEKPTRLHAK